MFKKLSIICSLTMLICANAFSLTTQTITFPAIQTKYTDGGTFNLTATASSGLTVNYIVTSGGTIASVSGNVVTISGTATGLVTIKASQSGDITYAAATDVYQSFSVTKHVNTVTLTAIPTKYPDSSPFSVTATATNGTVRYFSSNALVATIDSTTGAVTMMGQGVSTITALVRSSANYLAGSAVSSLTITKHNNAVILVAIPPKYMDSSPFSVSATVINGTVRYFSSNSAVATVDSTTGAVTMVAIGTTTITALVRSSTNYFAASTTGTLTITKHTNTVTLTAIPPKYMDSSPFSVSATAVNGTVRYFSSNAAVATVDSTTGAVTLVAMGTTTITALVRASISYLAGSATGTLTVTKHTNTVTLTALQTKYMDSSPFSVSATATNGTVRYFSANAAVATVDSTTGAVTLIGLGTSTITALVRSSATYLAGSATGTLNVSKHTNTVTLAAIPTKYPDSGPFSVSATATNGTVRYFSSNTAVATVDSTTGAVTVVTLGTTTITALVRTSATYLSGLAAGTLTITKHTNAVALATIPTKYTDSSPFSVSATATNGTVRYFSSNALVATVDSTTGAVTMVAAGTTTITALVRASVNYFAGSAAALLVITSHSNAVSLNPIPTKYMDSTPFSVSGTATNGTVRYFSSNALVATVDSTSGAVTLVGLGTTTITALVRASGTYLAGSATRGLVVTKHTNTVTLATIPAKYTDSSPFSVSAIATNGTVVYFSSNTAVATVDSVSGAVTLLALGSTTITALVRESASYFAGSATTTLTIAKHTNTVTLSAIPTKYPDSSPYSVSAIATNGTVRYFSSNTSVATVDSTTGVVSYVAVGSTTITALVRASANYLAVSTTGVLTITKHTNVVTVSSITGITTLSSPFSVATSTTVTTGTAKYFSSNALVATVDSISGMVTIVGAGTTTISAKVAASANYFAGTGSASMIVSKVAQTITWSSIGTKLTTSPDFPVSATSSALLTPVIISVVAGPAMYAPGMIHLTGGAGTVILKATQAGNSTYAAVSSTISFSVAQGMVILDDNYDNNAATFKLVPDNGQVQSVAGVNNGIDISIYPNPSNGEVFINSSQTVKVVSVYSSIGQLISRKENSNQLVERLDLNGLPKGVYFVQLTLNTNEQPIVKKVILE